jgi:hypothetical protein
MDVKSDRSRSESERVEELCQWLGANLEDDLTKNCRLWANISIQESMDKRNCVFIDYGELSHTPKSQTTPGKVPVH